MLLLESFKNMYTFIDLSSMALKLSQPKEKSAATHFFGGLPP